MLPDLATWRRLLLRWYDRGHRDLPWRRTRDPYRIWVSEIMLQQTRVDTVVPYYARFLSRFPDVDSLARAPLDDVLALWSGLGYYRRARMLHAAAQVIHSEHSGVFPRQLDDVVALPGIGRSTAGAILSISHDEPLPVLDGNVQRVLCRWFSWRGDPARAPLAPRLWSAATALVDDPRAGDVNQALMELGATLCLPFDAARCSPCPLARRCAAHREGVVALLPARPRPKAPREQTWAVALVRRGARVLVRQRGPSGLLHGLWELPTVELPSSDAASEAGVRRALARFLATELGLKATVGAERMQWRHAISNRRVTERILDVTVRGRVREPARWLTADEISALPITTATRKILTRTASGGDGLPARGRGERP